MIRSIAALTILAMLAACTATVHPQQAKIESSGVTVTVGDRAPGSFCPPGQAKKGRC